MATTMRLAMEFASPRRKVLVVASTPTFQYSLKNTGKKPAITVVAKAELAQSYRAQDMTFLSVARFAIPAVVSVSAGISPWSRFSRSLYPNITDPSLYNILTLVF
jgi:hypothetical protein